MADELQQQATPSSTETSSQSVATAPAAVSSPSQSSPTATADEYVGIRDYAKTLGADLSSFGDDTEAVSHLISLHQRYPQLEQLARYGSEYLENYDRYQAWLKSQQAGTPSQGPAGAAPPSAPRPLYSPPSSHDEIQKLLARWYVKDPTGQIRPRPEAPPSVVKQVAEYTEWAQDWETKLRHNPQEAFGKLAQEEARKVIQEVLAKQQQQQSATSIIQRHASWMFYPDPRTGVPVYGNYTPHGVSFWNHVQNAERQGVRDVFDQEQYALSMLRLELYQAQQQQMAQGQQTYPATPPASPPAARRQPNYAAPAQAVGTPNGAHNLAHQIRANLAANGITRFALPEE